MYISFIPQAYNQPRKQSPQFTAMKKSQFSGLDFFVVEKFKAPIEKFNTQSDFQAWTKTLFDKLRLKNFKGRSEQSIGPRSNIIEDWANSLSDINSPFSNAEKLLILSGVTAGLKLDTDEIPPTINNKVLTKLISDLKEDFNIDRKKKINFKELYNSRLKDELLNEYGITPDYTGWVEILSRDVEPEKYENNVDLLKVLSHKFWCTKHYTAHDYLIKKDFSIYLENGEPKLGLRIDGLCVIEVQGELNDGFLPVEYLEIFEDYFQGFGFGLDYDAVTQYEKATALRDFINQHEDLEPFKELNTIEDAKAILSRFTDSVEVNEEGLLTVLNYRQPDISCPYYFLGVDENKLFQYISEIKGDVSFKNRFLTDLGNLKKVDGVIYIGDGYLDIKDFDNIKNNGVYSTIYDTLSMLP